MDEENKDKKNLISRRKFFVKVGNTATAVAIMGGIGVTLEYLSPNVLLEIPRIFKVGPIEDIQPDTVVYNPEHKVYVFREKQGGFYALSAVCTHLGCTTKWKASGIEGHPEGVIACPCHGSVFDKKGNVLHGPAPRPLDRFSARLEDDNLVINTDQTVTEDEMEVKV